MGSTEISLTAGELLNFTNPGQNEKQAVRRRPPSLRDLMVNVCSF